MAKIHTLTYNGTKSSDLGVFVSGSGSFDAAELDMDKYEIPGRNGDLILSNNRYKNIEITYPAFIPKAFMDKVQNVRNWLRSSKVYARLEDTYDMDHYRLGIPTGVQSFSPENRNDGANFEMTFDCKPQRFLKVGETPETVEADVQTETGEIVTFETVAESPITSASVSLSPIQSLNGYDSPWPGGGGKNKFPILIGAESFGDNVNATHSNSNGTLVVNCTATNDSGVYSRGTGTLQPLIGGYSEPVTYSFDIKASAAGNVKVGYEGAGAKNVAATTSWQRVTINTTATGTNRAFLVYNRSGSALTVEVKDFMFQTGTIASANYEPYENICPISGHTGAELYRTGKNLYSREGSEYNVPVFGTDGSSASYPDVAVWWFRVKPNTTYHISFVTPSTPFYFRWINCDSEKGFISRPGGSYSSANLPSWITTPNNARWVQIAVNQYPAQSISQNDWEICISETASAYEPYQGDTYSVTFPETIYGGNHEFVSGNAAATMAIVDLGTLAWEAWTGYLGIFRTALPSGCKTVANNIVPNWLSSCFNVVKGTDVASNNGTIGQLHQMYLIAHDDSYSTAASFKTAVSGQTLVYELATPLEYTLSPQQLTTLQGQNVVWSDAGEITLTYAEPYNIENPTLFDARPLFKVTNPAEGDVIMVNGQAITFVDGYTGTVFIDCETMNAYSGAANLNSIIQATDFPVLAPGTNIVTWTGAGECTMTPRWWEL